jgi:hypothetical protein
VVIYILILHIDILAILRYLNYNPVVVTGKIGEILKSIIGAVEMSKPEGYVGTLSITWENGERNIFQIAQAKGYIWVGDHFVSPRNEKSLQGILREIGEVMGFQNQKIKQYTWLEMIKPIQYPK